LRNWFWPAKPVVSTSTPVSADDYYYSLDEEKEEPIYDAVGASATGDAGRPHEVLKTLTNFYSSFSGYFNKI